MYLSEMAPYGFASDTFYPQDAYISAAGERRTVVACWVCAGKDVLALCIEPNDSEFRMGIAPTSWRFGDDSTSG